LRRRRLEPIALSEVKYVNSVVAAQNDATEGHGAAYELGAPLLSFGILVVLFLAYDYCSYRLPPAVGRIFVLCHAGAILCVALVRVRWGLLFVLVSLIFADDIPRIADAVGGASLHSLLTVPVAGVAAGNYAVFGVCAIGAFVLLVRWSQHPRPPKLRQADVCILGILSLYVVAVLHGLPWVFSNFRGFLNDLNFPIMAGGLYLITRAYVDTPEKLARFWTALFMAAAVKTVVWAVWFLLGIGATIGTRLRVSTESGRVLLVFVLAYGLILQDKRLVACRRQRLLAVFVTIAAAFNLLFDGSRGPWVMSAYALAVLLALGRVRSKVRWFIVGCLSAALVAVGLWWVRPETYAAVGYFWSTLKFWEEGNIARSHSTMVRVYEFKNIHEQLVDHDNLILGEGPGSLFSDRYHPFPFGLQENDFLLDEVRQRQFQNPHGLLQNLILDTGYGGMTFYLCLVGLTYFWCFRVFRRLRAPPLRAIALSIIAFLPAMVYMSWSAKNNMLAGIFLGTIACLQGYVRVESSLSKASDTKGTLQPARAAPCD